MKIYEKDIQRDILEYLNHFAGCFCFKIHNVGIPDKYSKSGFRRLQMPGISDIIGLTKQGRFIAIEVKCKGNKLTLAQEQFLKLVNQYGGIGIVAYSLDDLIEKLKGIK